MNIPRSRDWRQGDRETHRYTDMCLAVSTMEFDIEERCSER
jgi:hypothetical protein